MYVYIYIITVLNHFISQLLVKLNHIIYQKVGVLCKTMLAVCSDNGAKQENRKEEIGKKRFRYKVVHLCRNSIYLCWYIFFSLSQ